MNDDWRNNAAAVAIVEFALRSVIRAHPSGDDEGQRLRTAMKMLFGIAPSRGKPTEPDLEELLFMARGYAADRGTDYSFGDNYTPRWSDDSEFDARSTTALANAAIQARLQLDPNYKPHNTDEKVRNLVDKFQRSRDGLLRLVVGWGDDGGADVFVQNVIGLRETLELLGIPIADLTAPNRERNTPN
ncbi:hypothetical protein [Pseudooceanicola sp. LIPI14-2-Ac024]|uniref:hypothetical protein n=1 Tax=Pseudooceanicola sp. LIPI14-2-Ac024 TaxID=3344875 RepID=UPI0035CEA545